jgi:hypothetical protein
MHQIDRTRVRLLFGDASFWEVLDQDFRLDLEFSSQFINPDLIGICHSPLGLNRDFVPRYGRILLVQ